MNEIKDEQEFKDDFVNKIIAKGSYAISNEDFENQIISKIHAQNTCKKEIVSKIKLSMSFLCVGLLLAFMFSFIFLFRNYFYGESANVSISILILFFSMIAGIFSIKNYTRVIHSFSF